jgi:peptide deformylase
MLLKIYYYGHPILRKHCEPVKEITDEIRKLASDMIETMDKNNGIGLAAPQIGRSIRMFVLRNYIFTEDGHWTMSEPKVYINPKLTNPSEDFISDTEACLSLPGLKLHVDRPDKITVEALDLEGKTFVEELEGYNARVRMHENDHINGVLFIDRVDASTRKQIDSTLKELKKKSATPT